MDLTVVGKAFGMFAVTNVDDIVVLTLFFGQARGRAGILRVAVGQYVGFMAILAAAVIGAAGVGLLPRPVAAYLGLVPVALGLRAGWRLWRDRHDRQDEGTTARAAGIGVLSVGTVTVANGGDNIGVYLPVFATTSTANVVISCAVFLAMVGIWCALGRFLATRRPVARALSRWGHILLPAVLTGIGLVILMEGGAFGV